MTTRTYVQYNADGSTTTETTLYPHAITVDSSDYTLTYTVEGITYTENLSLNIGDNLIYRELPSYDDQWLIYVDLNIIFEQAEPMGTVTIDGGAEFTNNPTVTLSLTFMGTIPPPEMRFSVDNGNTWTNWQEIASEKVLTSRKGTGKKKYAMNFVTRTAI